MKKTAIAVAVAVAAFASVAQAAPKDNTWYAGGKLGWSQYQNTGTGNVFGGENLGNTGPTHKDQLGAGAYVGFQHNQYMGFELGYDWLGRMPYKGDGNNGAFKAQGVQLTTKLSYPVMDDLDVYTVWVQWYGAQMQQHLTTVFVIKTTIPVFLRCSHWVLSMQSPVISQLV